ncbi:MAG: hypothetical protein ACRELG_22015, partial [Gemmataceae bacterium]
MLSHITASTGSKPSIGQPVSVIVRQHLIALKSTTDTQSPALGADDITRDCREPSPGRKRGRDW